MNGKAFTILNPRSPVRCFRIMAAKNTEKSVSLADSDVQTFVKGKKTKIRKEKPKVTLSMALVTAFLVADNESRQLKNLPQADFGRVPIQ